MKNFFTMLAIGVMLTGVYCEATAQVSALPFRQYMDTWTPLVGGTVPTMTGASLDDGYWTVPIGFTFQLAGINYTTCFPGTNGYLCFGSAATSFSTGAISILYGQTAIACMSLDLYAKSSANCTYSLTGTAPNRVLTIQWFDFYRFAGPSTESMTWQVKLYETSNKIDIIYGPFANISATFAGQVGVRGTTTADYSNRMVTSGVHTWPTSVAGTVNTATCTVSPTLLPPAGLTYSWGCNVPAGSADMQIVDATGAPIQYVYSPGLMYINYMVNYPLATAYNIPVTLRFYRIGDPSGLPAYTTSFDIAKPAGVASGTVPVSVNLAPAYYRVEATFRMLNNCGTLDDFIITKSILSLAPGMQLCLVWPGDVNNDGIVNFGDRDGLNRYIRDAMLSPLWLTGPARYIEGAGNPFAYIQWVAQPGIPWATPEGCYMDADGNGVVNNFDYLAMKINWFRTQPGYIPTKQDHSIAPLTFGMDQNFPNPFNPSTAIQYSVPERSHVRITVNDMLGREVATLVDGVIETGVHTTLFEAIQFNSGIYIATITMTGLESGLTFSKTIKMTLSK